jgi:hypothetical protein
MPAPPYNGWIFGGRLRFYTEEIVEKIPMGFNSKESFTKVDENSNVADRVRVEMMELKPVEIKNATEGIGGEGQTPFSKMVELDNFVYILHGKRLVKRRVPVDEIFPLKQTLRNKIQAVIIGALTVSPLPRRRLRFLPLPILLVGSLGCHFRSFCHEPLYKHALWGCREGVERLG